MPHELKLVPDKIIDDSLTAYPFEAWTFVLFVMQLLVIDFD